MKHDNDEAIRVKAEGESDAEWLTRLALRDEARRREWSQRWTVTELS